MCSLVERCVEGGLQRTVKSKKLLLHEFPFWHIIIFNRPNPKSPPAVPIGSKYMRGVLLILPRRQATKRDAVICVYGVQLHTFLPLTHCPITPSSTTNGLFTTTTATISSIVSNTCPTNTSPAYD